MKSIVLWSPTHSASARPTISPKESLHICVSLALKALIALLGTTILINAVYAQDYDLAILDGRVMDPETGFDAVRNVGIKDGKIAIITSEKVVGEQTIDASGHVVAPGFVDYHTHAIDALGEKLGLRDGVTTGMDLEGGALNVSRWYESQAGNRAMNYGTTVSQIGARMLIHDSEEMEGQDKYDLDGPLDARQLTDLFNDTATDGVVGWSRSRSNLDQLNRSNEILDEGLRQGALGVGSVVGYMREGVTSFEQFLAQKAAANYGRVTCVHARFYPGGLAPVEHPIGFDEVFTNAFTLDAPLLYQHNMDYGWWEIEAKLAKAREKGLNVWSEMYPYVGGSTVISAEYLLPDTFEKSGNIYGANADEGGIYDPVLDKFYTKDEFLEMREKEPGRFIIVYYVIRKPWILEWIRTPHMTVASDGVFSATPNSFETPYEDYAGHPRTAGTRARTLRLARENGIDLMHVIANASYWPARHLGDTGVEAMQVRGRIQEGMVADITIFDPDTVTDNATYRIREQGLPSTGIPYVIINGTIVVNDSQVQEVYPGEAIRFPAEEEGRFVPLTEKEFLLQFPRRFLSD